jgi:hypothetical protein
MMSELILFLAFCLSFSASADVEVQDKDFTKQIYVVGVGQVKLDYKYRGEPVSRPRALQIWVKCPKAKKWTAVGEYQMCALDKYDYDAKTKKLSLKYQDGRVNERTGESFCDQAGSAELDLSTLCKPKP